MSEVMTVQIFIGTVSLLGPLVGSFILCRKYRKICDTFSYDEEKAKISHARIQIYQLLVMTSFVYGLLEALTLGKQYGAVPYTAVIAGLLACFLNCVSGVIKGLVATKYVSSAMIIESDGFSKGMIRMALVEIMPMIGIILYIIGLKI